MNEIITTAKAELKDVLTLATQSIFLKNDILPILNYVLVSGKDTISVRATNLDVGVIIDNIAIKNPLHNEISFAIDGKDILQFINRCSDEVVHLSVDIEGNNATIMCGNDKLKVPIYRSNEYPLPPVFESKIKLSVGNVLSHINSMRAFCTTEKNINEMLKNIHLKIVPQGAVIEAASSFLMAQVKIKDTFESSLDVLITQGLAHALGKLKGLSGDYMISKNANNFGVQCGNITIYGILPIAKYPDINKVVPVHTTSAIFKKQNLIQTLEKVMIAKNQVRIELDTETKISAENAELGKKSAVNITPSKIDGKTVIGFNGEFLIQALNYHSTEDVTIFFGEGSKSIVIQSIDKNALTKTLVAPVQI